jgi:hypothetical protein
MHPLNNVFILSPQYGGWFTNFKLNDVKTSNHSFQWLLLKYIRWPRERSDEAVFLYLKTRQVTSVRLHTVCTYIGRLKYSGRRFYFWLSELVWLYDCMNHSSLFRKPLSLTPGCLSLRRSRTCGGRRETVRSANLQVALNTELLFHSFSVAVDL